MIAGLFLTQCSIPDYLQARGGVLVVLGVSLEVVNVDVGEAGQ